MRHLRASSSVDRPVHWRRRRPDWIASSTEPGAAATMGCACADGAATDPGIWKRVLLPIEAHPARVSASTPTTNAWSLVAFIGSLAFYGLVAMACYVLTMAG